MTSTVATGTISRLAADVLILPVFGPGYSGANLKQVDHALGGRLVVAMKRYRFHGRSGENLWLQPHGTLPVDAVVLCGCRPTANRNAWVGSLTLWPVAQIVFAQPVRSSVLSPTLRRTRSRQFMKASRWRDIVSHASVRTPSARYRSISSLRYPRAAAPCDRRSGKQTCGQPRPVMRAISPTLQLRRYRQVVWHAKPGRLLVAGSGLSRATVAQLPNSRWAPYSVLRKAAATNPIFSRSSIAHQSRRDGVSR